MSNRSYKSNKKEAPQTHGGYRNLVSYQTTTIIYDLTVAFTKLYVSKFSRTVDQMVQAARSGRQNIAEGSQASATSKKTEIKLVGVARASLEELLLDFEDYLRQNSLALWEKENPQAQKVRVLAYTSNRSYSTYSSYLEVPETAANCIICLIHQANYLLDRQLQAIEQEFIKEGGYTENLFKRRLATKNKSNTSH